MANRARTGRWGAWLRSSVLRSMLAAAVLAAACIPGRGPPLDPVVDDAGTPPPTALGDDSGLLDELNLGPSFAVTGLQPSHGPWTGGTRTTITGRGFSSNLQVSLGATLLPGSNVFASDPTQVAVLTPPGTPGPVDVRVLDVSSGQQATLAAGFIYDAFSVTPGTGATTGGTRIALQGSGTAWTAASTVRVGSAACAAVTFTDATDIACTTPANGPGSQSVTVLNADGTTDEADDAFVYSDSPDGYRGGLYGGALSGTLTVLGFDAWTGAPLQGGQVIAGSNLATAQRATLDGEGTAQLTAASLSGKVTVTVAAACHQPMTYVDVPVDTVTMYLTPALDLSCQGDPPSTGNFIPQDVGTVAGELVWSGGIEFERAAWLNIPVPGPNERQAAYVFTAAGSALQSFTLPNPSTATTPATGGKIGYEYNLVAVPGNTTVYALAGLEEDSDAGQLVRFEPFAMGVARGVAVQPNVMTVGVDIPMTTLLDRTMTTVPQPPATTLRGPDHLLSILAIDLGSGSYATLPQGAISTFLPIPGDVSFVGVPALDGTLAGATYDLAAAAVTGGTNTVPFSVVTGIETTDANDPVTLGGFFAIPALVEPSTQTWGGTHVTLQAAGPVDLALVDLTTGDGLVTWQVVAPGTDLSFDLPDLTQVQGIEQLVHGSLVTTFAVARIDGFQYGLLRSGQLASSAWSAYAEDVVNGSY
jgi:IPT/TIG domain